MAEYAELTIGSTTYSLPVVHGTEGERALDLSALRVTTGLVALDPGYQNTAACRSRITFVNGEDGILRYRGYPIEDLVGKVSFLDVAQLLIGGELPTLSESQGFEKRIRTNSLEHGQWKPFFDAIPVNAHPMAILSSGINMMSMYFPRYFVDDGDPATFEEMTTKLLSSVSTIAAFSYKKSRGEPFVFPEEDGEYLPQFFKMMFSWQGLPYSIDDEALRLLDALLVLHADHEQNCSTSTVRLVGSSRVNLYSSVCAGICALWGPLHGGANQKVVETLEEIRSHGWRVSQVLDKVKSGKVRLAGFGHRVYKTYDPRAKILKALGGDYLSKRGSQDPLLEIALTLEQAALRDPYFQERHLYPNVDFYSGLLYRTLGIPTNMFPVMFAMGRLPGWIAHWKEMHETLPFKIGRPRQLYVGSTARTLISPESRE